MTRIVTGPHETRMDSNGIRRVCGPRVQLPTITERTTARGGRRYDTYRGRPCPEGHTDAEGLTERLASNSACVLCHRERSRRWKRQHGTVRDRHGPGQ
jgi:hypothetical protein